ncbi:MAG: M48 family metallopeptidase, partial [Hyphomicrobiales bacterium]|nr:M48 family metallopeptidase [Hyphomicrobiales bacterium]
VPLRGAEHGTMHVPDARGVAWVARVGGAPFVCVAGRREHFARRLADFLKREARRDVEAAVARHAGALGMRPAGVSIRDTRSRWGSCSHGGALNFSWRLILAPPFVLDYLCAHEVAHLAHMDHSARFWALTRRLCPRTDEAEAWLRVNGSALHRFGAQDGEEPADGGAVD